MTDQTREGVPTHAPFETVGYPSLSFRDREPCFSYVVAVKAAPEWVQCVDEDGALAYWQNDDGTQGGPKMAGVTEVQVLMIDGESTALIEDDEDWYRSVWAVKPSSLYHAIRRAAKAARSTVQPGGTLTITYVADGPKPTKKTLSPQKLYEAVYEPPAASDVAPY